MFCADKRATSVSLERTSTLRYFMSAHFGNAVRSLARTRAWERTQGVRIVEIYRNDALQPLSAAQAYARVSSEFAFLYFPLTIPTPSSLHTPLRYLSTCAPSTSLCRPLDSPGGRP